MDGVRKRISLPIGLSDFRNIRNNGQYYIDKTGFIGNIIRDDAYAILFTRPRRFGKTTFQTMLSAFFDIRSDNSKLFSGLSIMQDKEAVECWMGQYPVIYLTLKDVEGRAFDTALDMVRDSLSVLYSDYRYVFLSDCIGDKDRLLSERIIIGEATISDICLSLKVLARALHAYYKKGVILLIDEYDVPLSQANRNGYYDEMLSVVRAMFAVMKDNPDIVRTVLTGCLRISKESIFTGINNLASYTLTRSEYAGAFGFTELEVRKLLTDANLLEYSAMIKNWYDGYSIGDEEIYSSWDVLQYVSALQNSPEKKPLNYWANSGNDDDIITLIEKTKATISDEYTALVNGGCITKKINENLTYNTIYSSADNIWSLLFETGYLTLAGEYDENGLTPLRLPNEEIRNIFAAAASRWFRENVRNSNRLPLFEAMWRGDDNELSRIITRYLGQAISYFDYGESFYHAFLLGFLASPEQYDVRSNRESGMGRPDVVVIDNANSRAAVFEFKIAPDFASLEEEASIALEQAKNQEYGDDIIGYDTIVYGVAFWKKKAFVKANSSLEK